MAGLVHHRSGADVGLCGGTFPEDESLRSTHGPHGVALDAISEIVLDIQVKLAHTSRMDIIAHLDAISQVLFGSEDLNPVNPADLWDMLFICRKLAHSNMVEKLAPNASDGLLVVDMMIELGLATSKREGREFVKSGAVRVNGHKVMDPTARLTEFGGHVIRRGKQHAGIVFFSETQ
jgi:tyrosyl-tRNA synthetase